MHETSNFYPHKLIFYIIIQFYPNLIFDFLLWFHHIHFPNNEPEASFALRLTGGITS